jgi:predicted enzyme related to lactoylglutathione lyase
MPAHDDTNVVFIEVEDWPIRLSAKHYGAVSSFVVVVPDTAAEAKFYKTVFGHQELMHHRISGAAIEKTVGLPSGAALDMRLLGDPQELYGRVELITYEGLQGRNLFPKACAPALGILGCRFEVDDMDAFCERVQNSGCEIERIGPTELLTGSGEMAALKSPAGLAIEVLQPLQDGA